MVTPSFVSSIFACSVILFAAGPKRLLHFELRGRSSLKSGVTDVQVKIALPPLFDFVKLNSRLSVFGLKCDSSKSRVTQLHANLHTYKSGFIYFYISRD